MDPLAEAAHLSASLAEMPDRRASWLKELPEATDPASLYYRFLYEWCRRTQPAVTVEIGCYQGVSAAHMAAGNPEGRVWTIDSNPDAISHAEALGLPNLTAVLGDSCASLEYVRGLLPGPVDLLYIDGWHSFNQTYGEYMLYRPLVRPGGLMLFDDLGLKTATMEMERFWEAVDEPKVMLPDLHYTGFGAVLRTGE
jgi:predicted O-methyltransferase YrrM